MSNERFQRYVTIPERTNINEVIFKASDMVGHVDLIVNIGSREAVVNLTLAQARGLSDLLKAEIIKAVEISDKRYFTV